MGEIVTNMFGVHQVHAMEFVIKNESGFRVDAVNKSSGACGLGQSLPCSKMKCELSFRGAECQLKWIAEYVQRRYGNPSNAQEFWLKNRWY